MANTITFRELAETYINNRLAFIKKDVKKSELDKTISSSLDDLTAAGIKMEVFNVPKILKKGNGICDIIWIKNSNYSLSADDTKGISLKVAKAGCTLLENYMKQLYNEKNAYDKVISKKEEEAIYNGNAKITILFSDEAKEVYNNAELRLYTQSGFIMSARLKFDDLRLDYSLVMDGIETLESVTSRMSYIATVEKGLIPRRIMIELEDNSYSNYKITVDNKKVTFG